MKEVETPSAFQTLQAETPATRLPAKRQRAEVAAPVQPAAPTTPMDLLRIVTERGANVAEISAFMDLMERQQAAQAKQALVRAMVAFKKQAPTIVKNATAAFTTGKGATEYDFATLGHICEKLIEALANVGISHDWTPDQPGTGPDANMIVMTCTLTHEQGGSKSSTVKLPADPSGSKNPLQAIGSAITYGERYSLLAACGIAVKEQGDDDGHSASIATDTSRADKWVMKAGAADSLAALEQAWQDGVAELSEKGDRPAYDEFKAAVSARKKELAKPAEGAAQ